MVRDELFPEVDDGVVLAAESHVRTSLDREVGGILVGDTDGERARVIGAIPALQAVSQRAQVTFTHEVWDEVLGKAEEQHPGSRIVGWYHSHPGFGIFLSDYDVFIHKNFFPDPAMVALVVDPRSGELGWFGWVDGEVEQLGETVRSAPPMPVPHAPAVAVGRDHRRVAGAVLAAVAAGVAGAVAGYLLGARIADDDEPSVVVRTDPAAQQQIDQLEEDLAEARSSAEDAASAPRYFVYTVQPGDFLRRIAQRLYGDPEAYVLIEDANPGVEVLHAGDQLRIPIPSAQQVVSDSDS